MTKILKNEADICLLITDVKPVLYLDLIRKRFPALAIETCTEPQDLPATLKAYQPDIALSYRWFRCHPEAHWPLSSCPSLQWLQVAGAGINHLAPWNPDQLTVTNSAGVLADFMAEYVLGAMLMTNFGFPRYRDQQRDKRWQGQPWQTIQDQTLVIIGLGRIGQRVAQRAKAFGLRVIAVKRTPQSTADPVDEVMPLENLHEALAQADYVALHVPFTEATRHLIDASALAAMKPTATLINTARGPVVDEKALITVLQKRQIAGAILDVFETEPLPQNSLLWNLDNVIVTPHISDAVSDWPRRMATFFCDNLDRWLAGDTLINEVDPERGY